MILDSDILIWFLRKNPAAIALIDTVPVAERHISTASYLEVLYGCRDKSDLTEWRQFVSRSLAEVLPLTEKISRMAEQLMERYVLARRLGLGDALTAATALTRGESLATGNYKHFRFIPGLAVKAFRP
ncbi:MAG: type II toxin-antitoxin system VapC family toxin [Acidobacteriota bacterium]|nr:type II toxin-antitoxin system VapC family toxin [Acidobacteriota bacterium]